MTSDGCVPLSEVALFQRGFDLPATKRHAGDVPVVAATGIVGYHDEAAVPAPGVVIGRSGSIGGGLFIEKAFWPLNTTLWVRDYRGNDPRWLYYLVRSLDFTLLNAGSGVPTLNRNHLDAVTVWQPDVSEQRRIAGVLAAFDDKIEHNSFLNRRLASWGSALFRQEVGEEADDWVCLGDVLGTLETGSRPRGGVSAYTEGVPSIGAESIVGIGVFDFAKTKYVPEDYFLSMNRGVLQSGDVLLYKDGGRPGMFEPHVTLIGSGFPFDVMSINEHVYRLRTKPPYSQEFLYFWLRSKIATEEMRARGTGVAIPGLNSQAVKALAVPVVDESRLYALTGKLSPVVSAILRNARTARDLQILRDLLLPKLVSGQIRVPESYDPDDVLGTVADEAGAAV